jgi:hypothetical protein
VLDSVLDPALDSVLDAGLGSGFDSGRGDGTAGGGEPNVGTASSVAWGPGRGMICGRSVMEAVPSQPIATPAMTSAAAAGLSACFMG